MGDLKKLSNFNKMAGFSADNAEIIPHPQIAMISHIQAMPLHKSKSFLKRKYVDEGLSIGQIAAQIRSSKDAVRNGLEKFNIPIRNPHTHNGNPSQPRYGQKQTKATQTPHKAEQRAIDAILEMRRDGASLRQIAKYLNAMKIPTKCRGRSWHPQMVKRVIDSNERDFADDKNNAGRRAQNG